MTTHVLECEMSVPVSVQEAFQFFEDPHNLSRITPPSLDFRIVTPEPIEMRKGAEIDYRIRLLGIPVAWKTIITEYEPPFFFVDEQARGPYRYWRHRHSFRPTEVGTVVGDRVEYALPLGWIGQAVHRLAVRRELRRIFAYRQAALKDLLRGAALMR
jgi:ligand-binding SRPBCC domain-containing protein